MPRSFGDEQKHKRERICNWARSLDLKEGKRKKKSGEPTEPSRSGAFQIIANPPPGFNVRRYTRWKIDGEILDNKVGCQAPRDSLEGLRGFPCSRSLWRLRRDNETAFTGKMQRLLEHYGAHSSGERIKQRQHATVEHCSLKICDALLNR